MNTTLSRARGISSSSSSSPSSVRAMVLAAGEGTRLKPLTLDKPKPMVPINGRPLLDYTVSWLRDHGIFEIAINLHYRPEVIVNYFGDGSNHGVHITYSHEERILGTAGAVRKIKDWVGDHLLVVVYGDVLTDLDLGALIDFHRQAMRRDTATGVTMSLYRVPNPTEVGLVGLDANNRVTRFLEKPKPEEVFTDLANTGILVIEPTIIDRIPADSFSDFGLHVLPRLLQDGVSIYGWPIPDEAYVLDIGSPQKYAQAQREWSTWVQLRATVEQVCM